MKYLALVGLALLLAVVAVGARSVVHQGPQPRVPEAPATAADGAATVREIAAARALTARLDVVAERAFAKRPDGPLLAYVPTRNADARSVQPPPTMGNAPVPPHREVSLLYTGTDGFKRAIIDGKYVRAGDRLPRGGRVVAINGDSVVVDGVAGRRTLRVRQARHAGGHAR
ncbi:MAG TPA: hypothetical protein VFG73_10985 [Rhodanobacteraceae bacterium]|nr:hypothetical protein [Rhodanobacteraceae bacterium]